MSYTVPVSITQNNSVAANSQWYQKSMRSVVDTIRRNKYRVEDMFDMYELAFGVKINYNKVGYVTGVTFKSESEATLFLLRWS